MTKTSTSFLLYPKHMRLMQAAADKEYGGSFTAFVEEALARSAERLGVTAGKVRVDSIPPTSLLPDLRYLDAYFFALLHLVRFLTHHARASGIEVPLDLKSRAISLTSELLSELARHPPDLPSGAVRPPSARLVSAVISDLD